MPSYLRVPSGLSIVPAGPTLLLYDGRSHLAASISATSTDDVVVRFNVGQRIVARGDILEPGFRARVATDVRCCYSSRKSQRLDVLRFLTDAATLWDDYRSATSGRGRE